MVTWIQEARGKYTGIILNAGAFTHTSVAIYDALLLCDQPVIEVHLSNIFRREPFRQHSYVAPAAQGLICGFGGHGYGHLIRNDVQLMQRKEFSDKEIQIILEDTPRSLLTFV